MKENRTLSKLNIAKRLIFCTILVYIAVFLVMNTSYFTRDNLHRVVFSLKQALSGEETEDVLVFEDSGENMYGIFKDGLVVLSNRSLSVYDASGSLLSETGIHFYEPVLRVSEHYILCFDRGGSGLLLCDSFGIVREKSFEKDDYSYSILDAQFGAGGKISVITDSPNAKGVVYVYSEMLEELYEFSSVDSYPVRADIFDKNMLSVVSLSPRKEVSDLLFYRIDYRTGEGYQSPVYSAEDRFPVSFVAEDDRLRVLTDLDLLSAEKDALTTCLDSVPSVTDRYSISSRYVLFSSLYSVSGRTYTVSAYANGDPPLFSVEFYDLRDIACQDNAFFVLAENKVHFLDQTGSILFTEELSIPASGLVASDDTLYAVGTGTAERIEIPAAAGK